MSLFTGLYLFLQVQLPLSLANIKHKHFLLFGWGKLHQIKLSIKGECHEIYVAILTVWRRVSAAGDLGVGDTEEHPPPRQGHAGEAVQLH